MYSLWHAKLRTELAKARMAAGMNQRELAAKLKRQPSYVGKIETADRKLEIKEFVEWCAACGVDPCAILRRVKD